MEEAHRQFRHLEVAVVTNLHRLINHSQTEQMRQTDSFEKTIDDTPYLQTFKSTMGLKERVSLLSWLLRLLRFLGLLLSSSGLCFDALDFLDHEGAGDSVLNLLVGENATVWSSNGTVAVREASESSGTCLLDTVLGNTLRLLFDVLNSKFATGGLDNSEAVGLGSVGGASLVCHSSIQHV